MIQDDQGSRQLHILDNLLTVIPAQAGIQECLMVNRPVCSIPSWIPACAGNDDFIRHCPENAAGRGFPAGQV